MEKLQNPKSGQQQRNPAAKTLPSSELDRRSPAVWDCGSSLYDSVELESFQRRLDFAISGARSLSMPHLTDHRNPSELAPAKKTSSKIARSFQKLLRSVFSHRKSSNKAGNKDEEEKVGKRRWFVVLEDDVVLDKGDQLLWTIPEAPEAEKKAALLSPEIGGLVTKTMSARFAPRSATISSARYLN